jgi:hypothetical protein
LAEENEKLYVFSPEPVLCDFGAALYNQVGYTSLKWKLVTVLKWNHKIMVNDSIYTRGHSISAQLFSG